MDVTKSNFKELLPEIIDAIDSSSFLAVDGEFTGLITNGYNVTSFDTPQQYYSKVRSGALDFLFVQFGLSIFKQVKPHERYENKTYVFYLFPQQANRDAPDVRFLCQSSSLTFLAQNGFDFNKLFNNGIPYLKQREEDALREAMLEKAKYRSSLPNSASNPVPIPKQHQHTVDQAMNKIKELLSPNSKKKEVHIENCSSFVRKLIYQSVNEQLDGDFIKVETRNNVLVARCGVSQEQLDKEKREKADKEEESIQDAVGFTKIIRRLAESQKLIVGHNMLLDVCHMVNRFIEPLPENYHDFKEMVHSLFPKLLDTKHLVCDSPLSDLFTGSHLPALLWAIQKPPFQLPKIECDGKFHYDLSNEKFHDAGFDAYVTGLSFLAAVIYLDPQKRIKSINDSYIVRKHVNKLFLMKIPDTYIDLEKPDPEPARDHVFHVTFPKIWTAQNVNELFSPYGTIQINWLTDTSAWVGLQDKSMAERARHAFEDKPLSRNPNVTVVSYTRYVASTGYAAFSPRPNKRKSSNHAAVQPLAETSEVKRIIKKRKSSNGEHSIETILEEAENNKAECTLEDLEKEATSSKVESVTFPLDLNWD